MFFIFVNSICFATCFYQISCNRGKTDGETKKSKRKCFFQQKCSWSDPKTFASFSGGLFVDIRGVEVGWLLCFFVFLSYPKLTKDWIFSAFCFDHGWNKKRPFWSLFEMSGHCFSLFLLKDQYSLAFRCFIVPLGTDFKILFGSFYLF